MSPPPPIWLGYTPTAQQLEHRPLWWLHQALEQLEEATVPENYWRKVIAGRQAREDR